MRFAARREALVFAALSLPMLHWFYAPGRAEAPLESGWYAAFLPVPLLFGARNGKEHAKGARDSLPGLWAGARFAVRRAGCQTWHTPFCLSRLRAIFAAKRRLLGRRSGLRGVPALSLFASFLGQVRKDLRACEGRTPALGRRKKEETRLFL
ncbi:hypothetical protein DWV16_16955 [Anaerotruncus sp. AF02-27]|nr:hypothetical protein DWV16_16955 [Anaerotruncus sp. AF02-27]